VAFPVPSFIPDRRGEFAGNRFVYPLDLWRDDLLSLRSQLPGLLDQFPASRTSIISAGVGPADKNILLARFDRDSAVVLRGLETALAKESRPIRIIQLPI